MVLESPLHSYQRRKQSAISPTLQNIRPTTATLLQDKLKQSQHKHCRRNHSHFLKQVQADSIRWSPYLELLKQSRSRDQVGHGLQGKNLPLLFCQGNIARMILGDLLRYPQIRTLRNTHERQQLAQIPTVDNVQSVRDFGALSRKWDVFYQSSLLEA